MKDAFQAEDLASLKTRALFQAWPTTLKLMDSLFDSVFHKHAALAVGRVDWEWLKQGVREARARGEPAVGIILNSNGQFGTGPTTPPEMKGFELANDDPENKVLFLDRTNGIGVMRVVPWADLESGKAYASAQAEGGEADAAVEP